MGLRPLRERRRRATRMFLLRAVMLLLLIMGAAYSAWLAPWARPATAVKVEASR